MSDPGPRLTASGLAYEVSGAGPAVLMIHAGIADRTMWDPQWRAWSDRFTLIRYDQRGFGDSADPERAYSQHGDAIEVLDAAGCERAAVIGASFGGKAALDLALAAPERVSALVAVVATPSGEPPAADLVAAFERVEEVFERDGLAAANEVELQMWVDGPGRAPGSADPATRALIAELNGAVLGREEAREEAGNEIEPTPLEPAALDRLGELALPTLAIIGEHDQPSVNEGARLFAERTGAELVEIAGTAHMPSLERPHEFDAAVLGFLGSNSI